MTVDMTPLAISPTDLRWIKDALRRAHAYSRFGIAGAATGVLSATLDCLDDAVKPVCRTLGCGMPVFGTEGYCASCGQREDECPECGAAGGTALCQTCDTDANSFTAADLRAGEVPF